MTFEAVEDFLWFKQGQEVLHPETNWITQGLVKEKQKAKEPVVETPVLAAKASFTKRK